MKLIFTTLTLILAALYLGQAGAEKQTLPEYTAAEAKKHIGETANVTGRVDCVDTHRTSYILTLGGCEPHPVFCLRVGYELPKAGLDITELKGIVITVTGKIDNVEGAPLTNVRSRSQIVTHSR